MSFFQKEESFEFPKLDDVIYSFKDAEKGKTDPLDDWTLRNAVEGVQIFGGIGSGKSSGSGRELALALLKNKFGGIILTGKVDEKDRWVKYAEEVGRLDQLIIFEPGKPYKFNPLKYELERDGKKGGGLTDNIVSLFMSIVKMGNRIDGSSEGGGKEPFWILAMERCVKASVDLLKLAKKGKDLKSNNAPGEEEAEEGLFGTLDVAQSDFELTVPNIAKVLRDAPKGENFFNKFTNLTKRASFEKHQKLQKWADESYVIYCLSWASFYIKNRADYLDKLGSNLKRLKEKKPQQLDEKIKLFKTLQEDFLSSRRTYEVVSAYFLSELSMLAEKTRSSILEHFFAFAAPFRSGLLADYFSGETTNDILPEKTFEGKIILLNFPVKEYLQVGVYAQAIYKKLWQQAVERRKYTEGHSRPVFSWIDESQYFISQDDVMFQTTARSSGASTILISQNISNYYATIGGTNSKALVDSLLGNLASKIFHNNNDHVTNEWAANTIAKDYRDIETINTEGVASIGQEYQFQFLPKYFSMLKNGGEKNNRKVEAVVIVASKNWSTENNYFEASFEQEKL